jgi:hypothetical protein
MMEGSASGSRSGSGYAQIMRIGILEAQKHTDPKYPIHNTGIIHGAKNIDYAVHVFADLTEGFLSIVQCTAL